MPIGCAMPQSKGHVVQGPTPLGSRREPYKIYRDPLPGSQPGRPSKYPFSQLKVGDCFYVPLGQLKSQNALASAARQWAKRNSKDWKFVTRVVGRQVGLWRVA